MMPNRRECDVLVVGGGAAGTAAALASAAQGAQTLLITCEGLVGGDLVTGLPLLGCCNSRGQWIVAGVLRRLLDLCKAREGGYIGPVCDWRTVWGVCVDPEILRLAIAAELRARNVALLLGVIAHDVTMDGDRVREVTATDRTGRAVAIRARCVVDATGDATLACRAGAACHDGPANGALQPISLAFRMANVDFAALLDFVRDHPSEFLLAENSTMSGDPAECARKVWESGLPYVALAARGELLGNAIRDGRMVPCTAVFTTPTSVRKREVTVNATRLAGVDACDASALSDAYGLLAEQVLMTVDFLRTVVPGFTRSDLSYVAHRIGVRETLRVLGDDTLATEDVIAGVKNPRGIAKGAHHVDLHGSGTDQVRIPVREGRSYDIPFGCLLPRALSNLLVAGRCLSSSREANGSARVMGTCMATGEAAGTAAALCARRNLDGVRSLDVAELRRVLLAAGAVLDGVD